MDRTRGSGASRARRRVAGALAALAGALSLGAVMAEAAAADAFACRGSALRADALVAGIGADAEPVVANPAGDPCAADARTAVTLPDALRSLASAGVARATTAADAGGASAYGGLTDASLLSAIAGGITLDAVEAEAGYRCVDGAAVPYAAGQVVGLRVLGSRVADTAARTELDVALAVPPLASVRLATLTLNDVTVTPTSVTRTGARLAVAPTIDLGLLRLIGLDAVVDALLGGLLGTDIVIAEARASLTGDPCAARAPEPPPPPPPGPSDPTPEPPVDPGLRPPVIDDGPPPRTPLTDATILYHATDAGVTLECRLDGGPWAACTGRSAYRDLALGEHCFDVRARRGDRVGPAIRHCWTVVALARGCTASYRHGYFINASSTRIGDRRLLFHATTRSADGTIRLATRVGRGRLGPVAYRLDGRVVARGPRATLRFAQLSRTGRHTLQVTARAGGRRAMIKRTFGYVNYVDVDCDGREVVGRLAPRVVRAGGARIAIVPQVPRTIQGTEKLRFVVRSSRRHALSRVHFALDGRRIRNHIRSIALTGRQLRADGMQTLTVRLVPRRGRAVTVQVPFRTARA